jgi:hypothetical protein
MVYVEWIKNDWRYNAQADGWTFAEHFIIRELPKELPEKAEEKKEDELVCDIHEDEDGIDGYIQTMENAFEAASEAEGFFLLAVKKFPAPNLSGKEVYIPIVFSNSYSTKAQVVIAAGLADCLSALYMDAMQRYQETEDDQESS